MPPAAEPATPVIAIGQTISARAMVAQALASEDRRWLLPLTAIAAVELAWWTVAWTAGIAPAPRMITYLGCAVAALAVAAVLRLSSGLKPTATSLAAIIWGTIVVAIAASAFLPLKFAIPHEIPFWLDRPLERAELAVFGTQPWLALDRALGWAAVPMDWVYGAWLPVQLVILFLVMLSSPSPAKSRALLAYSLAWFLVGVVAAVAFSSAGPIFYDRLFGGTTFAGLRETLQSRGAWIALSESDQMWTSFVAPQPGAVAGISAVPSLHVAISLWIFLTARSLAPRAAAPALLYLVMISIGSVQLGWHYVSDGVAGIVGMIVIWRLAHRLLRPRAPKLGVSVT